MTTMYQTVDDPNETESEAAIERASARRSLLVWLFMGAAVLAATALWNYGRAPAPQDSEIATKAERASYHTALAELEVDLRRARLRDFQTTYPESQHLPAVRAQLSVLDSYETRAWAVLTDVMYNPSAERIDKLAAIQSYEQKWGASYLGGREGDIRALREELEIDPEPIPSRQLKGVKSPIPKNVPDQVMVGGPRAVPAPALVRPYVAPRSPNVKSASITPPEVRKNVTPRYPRSAQKRGINAVVELSLSIDADGDVRMTELVRADAERYEKQFIKASERAAMRTKYRPQRVNGDPVPVSGIIKRYVFRVAED